MTLADSQNPQTRFGPLLTCDDAATYLCVSARTLWGLLTPRGPIESTKIGRRVLVIRASLDAFIAERTIRVPGTAVQAKTNALSA